MSSVTPQVCLQKTPAFWLTLSWFITTNEAPTTPKVEPVRSLTTSSAPSRNTAGTAWSELQFPRSWLMRQEQLMVKEMTPVHVSLLHIFQVSHRLFSSVTGVKVKKGQEEVEIRAPVVVSNCGIFTTFQKLLPPEVQVRTGKRETSLTFYCKKKWKFMVVDLNFSVQISKTDWAWWNTAEDRSWFSLDLMGPKRS